MVCQYKTDMTHKDRTKVKYMQCLLVIYICISCIAIKHSVMNKIKKWCVGVLGMVAVSSYAGYTKKI